jgi:hypothetical protein
MKNELVESLATIKIDITMACVRIEQRRFEDARRCLTYAINDLAATLYQIRHPW